MIEILGLVTSPGKHHVINQLIKILVSNSKANLLKQRRISKHHAHRTIKVGKYSIKRDLILENVIEFVEESLDDERCEAEDVLRDFKK